MRGLRQGWLATAILGALVAVFSLTACNSTTAKTIAAPTATAGDITIAVDRAAYGPTEPIGVTVTNASKTDYYALTGRSGCTFLQLEEYNPAKNVWVPVVGCQGATPSQALLIPGKPHNNNTAFSEVFTLAPGNSSTNPNTWTIGLYRVSLSYSADASGTSNPQTAYSAGFNVVATS